MNGGRARRRFNHFFKGVGVLKKGLNLPILREERKSPQGKREIDEVFNWAK